MAEQTNNPPVERSPMQVSLEQEVPSLATAALVVSPPEHGAKRHHESGSEHVPPVARL